MLIIMLLLAVLLGVFSISHEPECTRIVNSDGTETEVCHYPFVPTLEPTYTPTLEPTYTPTPTPTLTPISGRIVPDQYTSIGSALVGITTGESVRVRSGVYAEEITVSVDGVTIEGLDSDVWIDGQCTRNNGIVVRASDVTIRGIGIKFTNGAAVRVFDSGSGNPYARLVVENSRLQDFNCNDTATTPPEQNQAGIASWYGGSGYRITGNQIHYRVELPGVYSTYGRGHGNGIWFKSDALRPSGGGHTITDNVITGGFDGIGGETEGSQRGAFDRDTLIARNHIIGCNDDGIQVEGGTQNVRVEDNIIENCGVGIAMASLHVGPAYIERNTITSNNPKLLNSGVMDILACFKVGNESNGTAYVNDNVCTLTWSTPQFGDGFKQTNSGLPTAFVLRNNRFSVSRYVIELNGSRPGFSFDGDCLQTSDTTRFVKWNGIGYLSFENWRNASGQETTGRDGRSPNPPC